jgi:ubiquinone/menaquinone biosynthesis C-methylase UbiE
MLGSFFRTPKTEETKVFYDRLMAGDERRGLYGKDLRFDPQRIKNHPSIQQFFVPVVREHIKNTDRVLDMGCGSGGFLLTTLPYCKQIVGVDISEGFVACAQRAIEQLNIKNASVSVLQSDRLPFADGEFDVVFMVDVVHHMENVEQTVQEAMRVLKSGGTFIVFEPNILNPLLLLTCVIDKNEWGCLKLGRRSAYRRIFERYGKLHLLDYTGLLIGPPPVRTLLAIADFLNHKLFKPFIGWLNPKIVLVGTKA